MHRLFLIPLLLCSLTGDAQTGPDDFTTDVRFFSDVLGDRLVVRPSGRENSRAADLELRIQDETFFDRELSEFRLREVATIQGGGLGTPGLLFFTSTPESQEKFIQLMEEFRVKVNAFRKSRGEIKSLTESWMGSGSKALSNSRVMGEIQMDFLNRPSVVSLNWDIGANRLWLSLDDYINIDSSIAEALSRLVENIPVYSRTREKYKTALKEKNEEINQSLSLAIDADDEPTADRIDTPTEVSDELKQKEAEVKPSAE
jgi:hypothetical protein